MREAGADAASFDAIVGGGPNGAVPHHHPGDRRVEPNELVVVDAGAVVDGYCSDCTRTFATGDLPDDLARAYEVTKDAQQQGLDAIHAGVQGSEVHELDASVIKAGGFDALQHGLGHGVGLDIHELPVMREGVDSMLERRQRRHRGAGHLPRRPRRRPDRGPRDRRRRRRDADPVHQGASNSHQLDSCRGRAGLHQPVQERDARRGRRADLAHRRVPAREARQGRRVRPHEAEGDRQRRRRGQDLSRGREDAAHPHRDEERPVPLRLGRRGHLHGRGHVRADPPASRRRLGRAAVPPSRRAR